MITFLNFLFLISVCAIQCNIDNCRKCEYDNVCSECEEDNIIINGICYDCQAKVQCTKCNGTDTCAECPEGLRGKHCDYCIDIFSENEKNDINPDPPIDPGEHKMLLFGSCVTVSSVGCSEPGAFDNYCRCPDTKNCCKQELGLYYTKGVIYGMCTACDNTLTNCKTCDSATACSSCDSGYNLATEGESTTCVEAANYLIVILAIIASLIILI